MDNDFRISVGIELVSSCLQVSAQFGEVINFPVENDPDALVFIVNGLATAGKINNAQSAHAQADLALHVRAFVVGTAVNDSSAHAADIGRIHRLARGPHHARYATHCSASFAPFSRTTTLEGGMRPCTAIGCSITRKSTSPQLSNQRNTSS